MQITLIQNPPYIVSFDSKNVENDGSTSIIKKISFVAISAIKLVGFFFLAVSKSLYITSSYFWVSFKIRVLGYYGNLSNFSPPSDFYFAIFRLGVWSLEQTASIALKTWEIFSQKARTLYAEKPQNFLHNFTSGIDCDHLQSCEMKLDPSGVPSDVQVNSLADLFKEIDFENTESLKYMPPSARKEGATTYTPEELRASLEKFIRHVNRRVPFVGTPPAHDTERLMAFYQQIEDAVRISIYKSDLAIKTFKERVGNDEKQYSAETSKEHRNLLEDRARIALNLAIAGQHCGTRYMGESMDCYYYAQGTDGSARDSLKGSLIETLALKRREIANRMIQKHLGTNVHSQTLYMQKMGRLLGLPGTQNITEHLAFDFDLELHLIHFFEEYTENCIIETLQEVIIKPPKPEVENATYREKNKRSAAFREQLIDWMQDQVNDWDKSRYDPKPCVDKIDAILNQSLETDKLLEEDLNCLQKMIELGKKDPAVSSIKHWDEYLDELFVLPECKDFLKKQYLATHLKKRSQLQKLADKEPFKAELKKQAFHPNAPKAQMKKIISDMVKSDKIKKLIPLEDATIERILKKKTNLYQAVEDYLTRVRRREFLQQLSVADMDKKGLSKELLEWILVSHGIFLPQKGDC